MIPKNEQLQALANGLPAFYRLIEKHTGQPVKDDFRRFASVSKNELATYLSTMPNLAEKHVMSENDTLLLNDHPILITQGDKWVVCWIHQGRKTDEVTFDDLSRAAAHFLMAYWPT
jgi:hypothetical protein